MSAMPSNVEQNSSGSTVSRRDFIALAGKSLLALTGLLSLGGLARFLSFQPETAQPSEFNLGPASHYPPGSRTPIPQAQAVLINQDGKFEAISLVCTHLGCVVNLVETGYACPCHGSRFDQNGNVLNGPARQPLQELEVEETPDGMLIVHTKYGA